MTEPADVSEELLPFSFTGRAGEYFRIWIVSLCLSLLTLGIYSAWGKVRKRRYLSAHTRLAGSGFDYHAPPLAILRGRVVALALFGGIALAGQVLPIAQWGLFALLLLLMPWIVVASARFNARNSTYRNIAFGFDGRIGEAARVFLGGGALALLTLGLAYPWYRARRARFIIAHHRYGVTSFATDLRAGGFVTIYVLAAAMIGGAFVVLALGAAAIATIVGDATRDLESSSLGYALVLGLYAWYVAVYAYVRARTFNLMANATIVGALRLRGTLRARRLAWLYLSNVIAVLGTLGIATAWATIRVARYRAASLAVRTHAPLESYVGDTRTLAGATGSEVGDLFNMDVSL